jgi:hypothetical protein
MHGEAPGRFSRYGVRMELLYCVACRDIVAPRACDIGDPPWDWCACSQAGMRRGSAGPAEVTAAGGPASIRIIRLSADFLAAAVATPPAGYGAGRAWRKMHASHGAEADPGSLFADRDCWAAVTRPGDAGSAVLVPYADVPEGFRPGYLLPELASGAAA